MSGCVKGVLAVRDSTLGALRTATTELEDKVLELGKRATGSAAMR